LFTSLPKHEKRLAAVTGTWRYFLQFINRAIAAVSFALGIVMLIGINILGFVVSFFQANWQRDAHGRMHCYSAVNAQLSLQDPQGATVASSPIYPCRHSNMPQVFRLDAVWWVRGINLFYDLNNVDLYKPRFMPATSSACG
jgi:hypothetical protein